MSQCEVAVKEGKSKVMVFEEQEVELLNFSIICRVNIPFMETKNVRLDVRRKLILSGNLSTILEKL